MGQFSAQELQLAKDTTQVALANAAKALAKMLKEDIELVNFELDIVQSPNMTYWQALSTHFHVLETEVIGQMQAHTYLIFSQENANKICKILLPANLLGSEEMRMAMLLELDNILAASVVSKFSDILCRDITGHIPKITLMDKKQMGLTLQNFLAQQNIDFSFKVDFVGKKSQLSTEFMCFFTNNLKNTVIEQFPEEHTHQELEKNKISFSHILQNIKDFVQKNFG